MLVSRGRLIGCDTACLSASLDSVELHKRMCNVHRQGDVWKLKCYVAAGVLTASQSEKGRRGTAAAAAAAAAVPVAADADKIKAEHMRSNSAMPVLDVVKLSTKSSLLPSTAAEAAQHAAAVSTNQPGSRAAASKLADRDTAIEPHMRNAQGKTGILTQDTSPAKAGNKAPLPKLGTKAAWTSAAAHATGKCSLH